MFHPTSKRSDDGEAFLANPSETRATLATLPTDDSFGEEFLASATSGESVSEDARDEIGDFEEGGPFLFEDELEVDEDAM